MFKSMGPQCQSCSMPLSKDKNGGGTNADGSKSEEYCSYCFADGKYIDSEMTLEKMLEKLEGVLKNMKTPAVMRKMILRRVPKLKRWCEAKVDV